MEKLGFRGITYMYALTLQISRKLIGHDSVCAYVVGGSPGEKPKPSATKSNLETCVTEQRNQQDDSSPSQLMRKQDLASFFQVEPRTIDAWMRSKRIWTYRIGRSIRFRLHDVIRHLEQFNRVN